MVIDGELVKTLDVIVNAEKKKKKIILAMKKVCHIF